MAVKEYTKTSLKLNRNDSTKLWDINNASSIKIINNEKINRNGDKSCQKKSGWNKLIVNWFMFSYERYGD